MGQRWRPACLCSAGGRRDGGRVDLWFAPIDLHRRWVDAYASVLDRQEIREGDGLAGDGLRERFVVGRGLLRMLLGRYLGVDPSAAELVRGRNGKPAISDGLSGPSLRFNVAHSAAACLVGFREGEDVGVDLERIRDLPGGEEVARRWFPPAERAAFFAAPPRRRPRQLLVGWTRVEARAKAEGSGLAGVLDRSAGTGAWSVVDVSPPGGYVASVACRRPVRALDLRVCMPGACCFAASSPR